MPSEASVSNRTSRVALGTFIGTTIEWYDFFLYGTASALIFSKLFFPSFDPLTGTLLSFATFGVAFAARPLGGVIFGHFGDRLGRKPMLVITLVMMGVATGLVGVLPGYATIGVAAPLLLVALRIVQGIAVGGEYGGAVLMAVEHAGERRRGFFGSWVQAGSPAGLILSNLAFLAVTQLPEDQLFSWGWRIPFLASFILVAVGLVIRLTLEESPKFEVALERAGRVSAPIVVVVREHWKSVLLTAGAYISTGVTVYGAAVFSLNYASTTVGFSRTQALMLITLGQVLALVAIPTFGSLSDRLGLRRVFIGGVIGMILLAFPWLWLLNTGSFGLALLGYCLLFIPYSAAYASMAAFFASVYDTRVGYSGFSLGYQLGTVVGSGLAPIIAAQLVASTGTVASVGWYMVLVGIVSLLSAIYLGRSRRGPVSVDAAPTGNSDAEVRVAHNDATRGD
ncbi:MAG: MFS transporter [Pseudonocardia sp. SCN 73-27]|nr:MAG: MFS transporter [Pseudonocardia sp. SCN 72-51]ODV03031.1 MAG: MFS transporter [Pseudonocardia sp. SCN 73-27]